MRIQGAGRVATRAGRSRNQRQISSGTGVLATIGATGPFVGLFGTVWGIMNSFTASRSDTTNLAVVAPGIAEALLTTAMGLIAAIPAVVIYNHLARIIAGYRALLGDASAQLLLMISPRTERAGGRARRSNEMAVRLGSHSRATISKIQHEINVTPFIDVILVC